MTILIFFFFFIKKIVFIRYILIHSQNFKIFSELFTILIRLINILKILELTNYDNNDLTKKRTSNYGLFLFFIYSFFVIEYMFDSIQYFPPLWMIPST